MKFSASLQRRLHWLNLPVVMLVALLQRTPLMRVAATAEEILRASPFGFILKSAVAAASLGAVNSLAGATPLLPSQGTATGVTLAAGTSVAIAYTVSGTLAPPESWIVGGQIPPGMDFSGLTTPGTVNVSNLVLSGTPTTAGTYNVTLQTFQFPSGGGSASPVFPYVITVTGGTTTTAPSFTTQPQNQTAAVGGTATFTVAVSGNPTPTLQWRKDGANLAGQTGTTLTLTNVSAASAGSYTAVATNSAGSATSNAATLTVSASTSAPAFTSQPVAQTVANGGTAVFSVEATGTPTPTYQWLKNGVAIGGATSALLVVRPLDAASAGSYSCRATNSAGSTTSNAVTLAVVATGDPGRLSALSIRGQVGAGSDLMIAGIISSGLTAIIQAVGPTLGVLDTSLANSVLQNPKLELYQLVNGAFVKANENDDWAGASTITAAAAASGATQLSNPVSRDSALLTTLQPGVYTANVSGINNTTGVALLQAYTVPSAGGGVLSALSIRGRVGAGGDQLIAGLIVAGSTAQTLLIQAVGPTLGVIDASLASSVIQNPRLELYQLVNGGFVKVRENDDWGGDTQISALANASGATPLSNGASRDSALLVTLAPGIYTANVSGVGNTGGVVLLQAYAVP